MALAPPPPTGDDRILAWTGGTFYARPGVGQPPFIREVFERYGSAAEQAGSAMLTAFGYDWVPGNLAGAIALARTLT